MRLRHALNIALLCIALLGWGTASAQNLGRTLGQEEFASIFREVTSHGAPWPTEDLVVRRVEAQPASLIINGRDYTFATVEQPPAARLGKNAFTVAILVEGKEEGRVRLTGDLLLYGSVLCTAKKLNRHQQLTASDLVVVRRDLGNLDPAVLRRPEEAVGKQLKTSLQAGAILSRQHLESPVLVKRGDRVTIEAQNGAIRVTVLGQARESGAAGDLIQVKNLMSRKEITARVIDSGLVQTEL